MERILTIIGTKGETVSNEYPVLTKEQLVKRIEELTDYEWGYSIIIAEPIKENG